MLSGPFADNRLEFLYGVINEFNWVIRIHCDFVREVTQFGHCLGRVEYFFRQVELVGYFYKGCLRPARVHEDCL